jgi:outer membrane protein assembly factor BamB
MKFSVRHLSALITLAVSISTSSSNTLCLAGLAQSEHFKLAALFPSQDLAPVTFDETIIASPLLDWSQGKPSIIVAASNGDIAALDAETGALDWNIAAPASEGQ